jgi:hypothetical protein
MIMRSVDVPDPIGVPLATDFAHVTFGQVPMDTLWGSSALPADGDAGASWGQDASCESSLEYSTTQVCEPVLLQLGCRQPPTASYGCRRL